MSSSKVILLAGLGFGDEGKGTVIDHLTREQKAHTVVRYNGGSQAAHNVCDGRNHHTFAQFGSGTLAGAKTHLSRFMMVNPSSLFNEAKALLPIIGGDPYKTLTVERDALVTTPVHVIANHTRESLRGNGRHGSCGLGIGETMSYALQYPEDAIRIADLEHSDVYFEKIRLLVNRKMEELGKPFGLAYAANCKQMDTYKERCDYLVQNARLVDNDYLPAIMQKGVTLFEGAQGVLLDQDFGFHPYTTWSDTTYGNAFKLIEGFEGEVTKLGITRSYLTRHGPGPFPSYEPEMDSVHEAHNAFGEWQREFRRGYLDLVLLRYALEVLGGVDEIAVTHMDYIFRNEVQYAVRYYGGVTVSHPDVFEYDEDGAFTLKVRKHDTMDEQLAWQSKITEALFAITPNQLGIYRHFRARDPESTIEEMLSVAQLPGKVSLLSYGPQSSHKRRIRL